MRLSRALRIAILPALGVGPVLGLLGAVAVLFVSALATGGNSGAGSMFVIVAMVGVIAGLALASPIAFVFGTGLIMLSARDRRWIHPAAVAGIGVVPGAATGALVGAEDGLSTIAVVGGAAAVLGAIGALMFRKLIINRIDDPRDAVDPAIFA